MAFRDRQRDIAKDFANATPSKVSECPFIFADRKVGQYGQHTENGGKWLIFGKADYIDGMWQVIKHATEEGQLGETSKVSTAWLNPRAKNPNKRMICVYTYDANDELDVFRIRTTLREFGVSAMIHYKEDNATTAGKYEVSGATGICRYSSK